MRKALVVASREIQERWLLLAAGLVLGCVPLVLPAFGAKGDAPVLIGGLIAFSLAAAAAVVAGATMLARDTADGRLAFLFARPLPWPAIWVGKWAAALVLVCGGGLLASLPWLLAYGPGTSSLGGPVNLSWAARLVASGGRDAGLLLPVLAVLVIGSVNLLATLYRARNGWLALDVALLLAALWGAARYAAPLLLFGAGWRGLWPSLLMLAAMATALLVGSAAQLAYGRTDLRRAHHALSAGFWSVVTVGLLACAGGVAWIEAAGPADVTSMLAVRGSVDGRWVALEGRTNRGGVVWASFLLDTSDGRYVPTTDLDWLRYGRAEWPGSASISADGRYALRAAPLQGGTALELLDLSGTPPRRTKVKLEASLPPTWWTTAALAPSGQQAVVVQDSAISLFALPSGKSIASAPLPPDWHVAAVRLRGEDARAWIVQAHPGIARSQTPSEVRVIDVSASARTEPQAFTAASGLRLFGEILPDARGDRLLTLDGGVRLRNGADGALLATLVEGEVQEARFLPDGRIAAMQVSRERRVLRLFDAEGRELRTLDLGAPGVGGLHLGPDAGPGRVVLVFGVPYYGQKSRILDLASGSVVQELEGLAPAPHRWWTSDIFEAERPAPGLFVDTSGRLLRLDFATGQRTVLAGPGAPRAKRIARF